MKVFIAVTVIIALAALVLGSPLKLTDEQKAIVSDHFATCIKEENLTPEEAAKVLGKDYANPSDHLKCFATCFFEKVGILKNNEVQHDVALARLGGILGEEKTKAIGARCGHLKGSSRCETGYLIFECYENAKKELGE